MIKILRPYQQDAVLTLKRRLKETTDPLLVNASVGAGKSLIIASILLMLEKSGMRALCLTLNSTLIQQNSETYKLQNGNCGVYCSSLKSKDCENLIIFASPNSICQGIRNKNKISTKPFQLIVIDEVHNLNFHDSSSMYMRIINHYSLLCQEKQINFRLIGLTGTPYRGKGVSIVGENQFFKTEDVTISSDWLIRNGFLSTPEFGLPKSDGFDFSKLKMNSFGKFNQTEIDNVIGNNERLTADIMREIVSVVESGRNGAFIFASSIAHCQECFNALPTGQAAIITGITKAHERKSILQRAANLEVKYLISVGCLMTGIDLPIYQVAAWLRPTESLGLYIQGIGRVLRLHESKKTALILDYAGNLERHGDMDDLIINEALQPKAENEKDFCIPCFKCGSNNTIHARRCIGINSGTNHRCDYFFQFKDCKICGIPNDITSRECRECNAELIDPNDKLCKSKKEKHIFGVINAQYWVTIQPCVLYAKYNCHGATVFESYYTNNKICQQIFYSNFVSKHSSNAPDYYKHLQKPFKLREMIEQSDFKTPYELICTKQENGRYKINKKLFDTIE